MTRTEALAQFLYNGWTPMPGRPALDEETLDDAAGIVEFLDRWDIEPAFQQRWSSY